MLQEIDKRSLFNQTTHYSYLIANLAIEPIRLYVWGVLRAFVAPSFDALSQKTQNVFTEAVSTGNHEALKGKISQEDFFSSSPYFKTKSNEIAFRFLLGTAILVTPLVGIGAVYLPYITRSIQAAFTCGILGQGLHSALTYFSKREFTVIQPENISEMVATCTSIASWNIGLVSVFAPLNVGTWESIVTIHFAKQISKQASRIDRQAKVIRNLGSDIVCFQEFFDPLQAKALYNQVRDLYPHAYLDIGAHIWKGPSGLGVFSKIPLQNFHVHNFKTEPQGLDKGTNKKFATFDVLIQGKTTRIYATHLNCGNNPVTRKAQLEEIKAHMDGPKDLCLILGDLNIDKNASDAVDTAYFNKHFIDLLPPSYTCSDVLKFKHSRCSAIGFECIDYIASTSPLETKNPKIQIDSETLNLSDHFPISVEF